MTTSYPMELEGRTSRLQLGWQSFAARKTRKARRGTFVKLTISRVNAGEILPVEGLPLASRLTQKQMRVVQYDCGVCRIHTFEDSLVPGSLELIDVSDGVVTAWRTSKPKAWVDWALNVPKIEPGSLAHAIAVGCNDVLIAKLDRTKLVQFLEARLIGAPIFGEYQAVIDDPQLLEDSNATRGVREDSEPSIGEILDSVKQAHIAIESRISGIFAAELLPIPAELQAEFLAVWKSFILEFRDTQDSNILPAVMSAIRKFVAEMPAAEIPEIGFLLDPSHVAKIPIELELTVAKMVVRKLTANPPQQDDPYPPLAEPLWELAHDYLRERFVSRKYFGAVALEATTALLMCRSPHTNELLSQLKDLGSRWFVEAMSDHFEETIGEIVRRNSDERRGPTVRALEAAVQFLGVMQPART